MTGLIDSIETGTSDFVKDHEGLCIGAGLVGLAGIGYLALRTGVAAAPLTGEIAEQTALGSEKLLPRLTIGSDALAGVEATTQAGAELGIDQSAVRTLSLKVNGETRQYVLNRFLNRLNNGNYVLGGSYSLELKNALARQANDLDLFNLGKDVVGTTRGQTSKAVLDELKTLAAQEQGDGLTFEVSRSRFNPALLLHPKNRQSLVVAKAAGEELMSFNVDMKLVPRTLLGTDLLQIANPIGDGVSTVALTKSEDTLASKLFTYTNRQLTRRKTKDLFDMANLVRTGVNEDAVKDALDVYASRGYKMGSFPHPDSQLVSKLFPHVGGAQSAAQLEDDFQTVKAFYDRVAPRVAETPLADGVSNGILSRSGRFLRSKLAVVHPYSWAQAS